MKQLLLLLLVSGNLVAQPFSRPYPSRGYTTSNPASAPQRVEYFNWNNQWEPAGASDLFYNSEGYIVQDIDYSAFGIPVGKSMFQLDSLNRVIGSDYYDWNGMQWIHDQQTRSEFDSLGHETFDYRLDYDSQTQTWDTTSFTRRLINYTGSRITRYTSIYRWSQWSQGAFRYDYEYDQNGHLRELVRSERDSFGVFKPEFKSLWYHKPNGMLDSCISAQMENGNWWYYSKVYGIVYEHFTGDHMTSKWNYFIDSNYAWPDRVCRPIQHVYTHMTNNSYDHVTHFWDPHHNKWVNYDYHELRKDNLGNITLQAFHDGVDTNWIRTSGNRYDITYDSDDRMTEVIRYRYYGQYQPLSSMYEKERKTVYSNFLVPLSIRKLPEKWINVYPNPAEDQLKINAEGKYQIHLLNLQGALIYSKAAEGESIIDITPFPPGCYLLNITNENLNRTMKVILN